MGGNDDARAKSFKFAADFFKKYLMK